jgi:tRNA(fMet)-specific endonuclease VapC
VEVKIMLDTNICIYIINNKPETVKEKFLQHDIGSIALSTIVVSELVYGVTKSQARTKNTAALEEFLFDFEILPFDIDAAYRSGMLQAELEQAGTIIGPHDTQIAAHALLLNAMLVTNNLKEFKKVKGLKLENWFE